MPALDRLRAGLGAMTDPVERRAYWGRLRWLARGSGSLQAWSLEYRAGLTGRYATPAQCLAPDAQQVVECPSDCRAHAPLAHLYQRRHVYRIGGSIASTATGATLLTASPEPAFFVRESITWPFESILSHGLDVPDAKDAQPGPDGPVLVLPTNRNYYHWLIEDLPLLARGVSAVPEATVIAYEAGITARHREAARALGTQVHGSPLVVQLRDQVLPGRGDDSWFLHPADAVALADLGARVSHDATLTSPQRIYVSRRGSSRSLPHEAELESLLKAQGFHIARLEELPWPEQIALFRNATVVVGPHGAGLANLVFTAPGATLIELTNGSHYNRCNEFICHVVGHRYAKVDADASPTPMSAAALADAITALA